MLDYLVNKFGKERATKYLALFAFVGVIAYAAMLFCDSIDNEVPEDRGVVCIGTDGIAREFNSWKEYNTWKDEKNWPSEKKKDDLNDE